MRSASVSKPTGVVARLQVWRIVTYLFLHGGLFHLLFNMLALWMFGVELERSWGSRYFLKYYFVCGVGAAAHDAGCSSLLPVPAFCISVHVADHRRVGRDLRHPARVRAVLPERARSCCSSCFPVPARYAVMIMGGIALLSSMEASGGGVAHAAHLGGLVAGYLFLKGGRLHLMSEIQYRVAEVASQPDRAGGSTSTQAAAAPTTSIGACTEAAVRAQAPGQSLEPEPEPVASVLRRRRRPSPSESD